jgi:acetyl esterase/lipase
VLSLDYRLAPEHPYPAARDDVVAAVRHLVADGADHRKLALVGVSTGASLVLSATLALRDAGEPMPGALALLSPLVDLGAGPGQRQDPLAAWAAIERHLAAYLASTPVTDVGVSPGLADLTGLPPLLIQAGGADPSADQAGRLAERARQAGVEVTCREWAGMVHGWQRFPHLHEAGIASNQVGDWLLQRLGPAYVPVPFEGAA